MVCGQGERVSMPDADPVAEIIPPEPMRAARSLLATDWTHDGLTTLLSWRGMWLEWTGPHWREVSRNGLKAWAYKRTEAAYVKGKEGLAGWDPTQRKVSELLEAMAAICNLPDEVEAPCWMRLGETQGPVYRDSLRRNETRHLHISHARALEGKEGPLYRKGSSGQSHDSRDSVDYLACENGLLNLDDRSLIGHSPAFLNRVSVPFAYDPDAPAPARWLGFLAQLWPGDSASIALLQEWFGYSLSGRTDLQKILLIIGPTRSGKGTVARVLAALVGRGHVAGPTLDSLGSNFGLSPLLGKSLALISDARLSGSNTHQVVERLLSISGEDLLTVDLKHRDPWTGKIPARFAILSNELPRFGDASGAIANRLLVLQMTQSFLGREDPTLTEALLDELPGILLWALDGLDRLVERGRFTVPQSAEDATSAMADLVSPVSAFVRECCDLGAEYECDVAAMHAEWRTWCNDNGRKVSSVQTLGRDIRAVAPQLQMTRPRVDGKQVRRWQGIRLKQRDGWTAEDTGDEPETLPCTECNNPLDRAAVLAAASVCTSCETTAMQEGKQ